MTDKEAAVSVDVAPVVHATWIEDDYGYYHCSRCGWEFDEPEDSGYTYCPTCGARMEDKPCG